MGNMCNQQHDFDPKQPTLEAANTNRDELECAAYQRRCRQQADGAWFRNAPPAGTIAPASQNPLALSSEPPSIYETILQARHPSVDSSVQGDSNFATQCDDFLKT